MAHIAMSKIAIINLIVLKDSSSPLLLVKEQNIGGDKFLMMYNLNIMVSADNCINKYFLLKYSNKFILIALTEF